MYCLSNRHVVRALSTGLLALISLSTSDASVVTFGSGANSFDMTFVEIGDPNNPDETTFYPQHGKSLSNGRVEYTYQMGKYEVSRGMITKANAAGSLGITLADMTNFAGNGADKPATGVSWNEAARFVNWLNTSQGYQAAYNFTTSGVNDNIALWDSADAWQLGGENRYRHKDAHYWLPSFDEWYKAAYFDPINNVYYDFATGSDTAPTAVSSGTTANTAVYSNAGSGPADITQAGGLSPYGIMGMSGNVFEWEETSYELDNSSGSSNRGVRGGDWSNQSFGISSAHRPSLNAPTSEHYYNGFRVAGLSSPNPVPEPATIAVWSVLGLCGVGYGLRRKMRKTS